MSHRQSRTADEQGYRRDEQGYRRTTRRIGWQVAAVSAALVIVGAILALAYVVWQTRPAEISGAPEPGSVRVFLDPADLMLAGIVVGIGAVVSAGAAAWLIARRAVRPLEEAAQMQRRFVADASHELRTPVAVLSARLQQLALLTPEPDPRGGIVDALRTDARILSGIVDDMLATATGAPVRRGACALGEVMAAAADDLALLAAARGVVVTSSPLAAEVGLPEPELRRCLVALIDNAIDHTPEGGHVALSAERHAEIVRITVADTGTGITGIDPTRVFERFAHGAPPATAVNGEGAARTRSGIGLSLVAELAERHGGAVRVARTGPSGTVLELDLPAVQAVPR